MVSLSLTGLHDTTNEARVVGHLTPLTQRLWLGTRSCIVGLCSDGGATQLYLEHRAQSTFLALDWCYETLSLGITEEQQT